jgi:hypothetical protein
LWQVAAEQHSPQVVGRGAIGEPQCPVAQQLESLLYDGLNSRGLVAVGRF